MTNNQNQPGLLSVMLTAGVVLPCLLIATVSVSIQAQAQSSFDLLEFVPYKRLDSTSLRSTRGTGFEFRFFSPTRDSDFDWDFRKGTVQRPQPFRRSTLRKNSVGLAVMLDTFYDPLPPHVNQFDPAWVIAPTNVFEGQVITSSALFTEIGPGTNWTGTANGTLTIGAIEKRHTPAGKVDALPLRIEYDYAETGPAGRGSGMVSQTWWLTRELGAFQVSYAYETTDTNGVVSTGFDEFHLQTSTLLTTSEVVTFPDPNLEAAVRTRLFKPTGDLLASDLAFLLDLSAPNAGITNLTGLEHAYRMASLRLASNNIADISVLEQLPKLAILDLAHNSASNIQPLRNLTNLSQLVLTRNTITDVSALQNLSNLRTLIIDENLISDISALSGLTNLLTAILGANGIVDVSPLAGLTQLSLLEIEANQIHDLTPLITLTRLSAASVEENCLDVTPGADDRLVIQGWIAHGTQVEPEWPLQFNCAPTIVTLGLTIAGDVPTLQWLSLAGAGYQIESSTNLAAWANAEPNPIMGTGGVLQWTGQITSLPQVFYRIRIVSDP